MADAPAPGVTAVDPQQTASAPGVAASTGTPMTITTARVPPVPPS